MLKINLTKNIQQEKISYIKKYKRLVKSSIFKVDNDIKKLEYIFEKIDFIKNIN